MKLMTLGYEGITSQQFFDALVKNKVQMIVDIRELPISRKAGFSKNSLSAIASDYNLGYIHMVALGCPKQIRHDYRIDGDWARYTKRFMSYISTQMEAMTELSELATRKRCCLVCFETDFNFCHRSFVADKVASLVNPHLSVVHLTAPAPERAALLHPVLV